MSEGSTQSHFSDRLADAIDRVGSPACVGLDPVIEKLPDAVLCRNIGNVEKIEEYCAEVLKACRGHVGVVKIQSACFERYGTPGIMALRSTVSRARTHEYAVVMDAKRGDIGITAEHYAHAAFGGEGSPTSGSDSLTISGYLGPDTMEAFIKPGRGLFVLVRTSNPGSDAVQSLRLADGRTVAEMMADHVATIGRSRRGRRGLSDIGAVVAATKPQDGPALRQRMVDQVFLIPGYGAQGGTPADVRGMLRQGAKSVGEAGVLVTASRSVIYAFDKSDPQWAQSVGHAAAGFAKEVRGICG